jgi:hypothetical protein
MIRTAPFVVAVLALGLSACTNPYDPVQRGLGGGILGAATGAAIGGAAGGGPGAALGAAIGGATGIFGGIATTPPPPGTYYGYPVYGYPAYPYPPYGYPGRSPPTYGYPGYSGPSGYPPQAHGYQGGAGYPVHPSLPVYGSPDELAPPPFPGAPGYEYQSPPLYSHATGSAHGSPAYSYPADPPLEDWPPGPGIVPEPSS